MTMRDLIKAQALKDFPRVDIAAGVRTDPARPVCSNLWRN